MTLAFQEFGEILFGMSYLPTAQRLSFSIMKAANLKFEEVVSEVENFSELLLAAAFARRVSLSDCFRQRRTSASSS